MGGASRVDGDTGGTWEGVLGLMGTPGERVLGLMGTPGERGKRFYG